MKPSLAQADVDKVREMLDLMVNFASNDQRARYLLTSNWMRERGAEAQRIATEIHDEVLQAWQEDSAIVAARAKFAASENTQETPVPTPKENDDASDVPDLATKELS